MWLGVGTAGAAEIPALRGSKGGIFRSVSVTAKTPRYEWVTTGTVGVGTNGEVPTGGPALTVHTICFIPPGYIGTDTREVVDTTVILMVKSSFDTNRFEV